MQMKKLSEKCNLAFNCNISVEFQAYFLKLKNICLSECVFGNIFNISITEIKYLPYDSSYSILRN